MSRPYQTKNIEQASAIIVVTQIDPLISFDDAGIATFTFPGTFEVANVIMMYESGLDVDARTILSIRNQLFKRIRGGRHE
ncbi:hypothetical protein HXX01_03830 [Candidatus Nomurabacteria bacterium]|nr:hypothetical protein [Candidatus Nomurabacteria bacterium]